MSLDFWPLLFIFQKPWTRGTIESCAPCWRFCSVWWCLQTARGKHWCHTTETSSLCLTSSRTRVRTSQTLSYMLGFSRVDALMLVFFHLKKGLVEKSVRQTSCLSFTAVSQVVPCYWKDLSLTFSKSLGDTSIRWDWHLIGSLFVSMCRA